MERPRKVKDNGRACVGKFYADRRIKPCKECPKCQRHIGYLYNKGVEPEYDSPTNCVYKVIGRSDGMRNNFRRKPTPPKN